VEKLLRLCDTVKRTSLCGLGQAAPNPVISTITHFRAEFDAHIRDKRCPAGICTHLLTYSILADQCVGCGACRRKCPAKCITGEAKKPHVIEPQSCVKCGTCLNVCKFGAVTRK
jgi:NAD-dependent dihydropyrimidine dehydrogenase PreA subunit